MNGITGHRVAKMVLTGALLGLAACAHGESGVTGAAAPAVATTSASSVAGTSDAMPHATLSVAVRARDDGAGADPRGILVVHEDVLTHCSRLQASAVTGHGTGAGAGETTGETVGKMAWLGVMRTLASCMKDGELRERTLVLHGPSRPQVIVKYIFAKLGVPEPRVQMSAPDGASCVSDEDCTAQERKVEIGLVDATAGAIGAL